MEVAGTHSAKFLNEISDFGVRKVVASAIDVQSGGCGVALDETNLKPSALGVVGDGMADFAAEMGVLQGEIGVALASVFLGSEAVAFGDEVLVLVDNAGNDAGLGAVEPKSGARPRKIVDENFGSANVGVANHYDFWFDEGDLLLYCRVLLVWMVDVARGQCSHSSLNVLQNYCNFLYYNTRCARVSIGFL